MQKSFLQILLASSIVVVLCVVFGFYLFANTDIFNHSTRRQVHIPVTLSENKIPRTTCEDLKIYFDARERLQQIPFRLTDEWVRETFGVRAKWINSTFPDEQGNAINFEIDNSYARIIYRNDQFFSLDFPINLHGQSLTDCLGDPTLYQAYIGYDFVPIDTPADKFLKITLFYREMDLSLQGLQLSHFLEDPDQVKFARFVQWHETTSFSVIAEYNIIDYGSGKRDATTWQQAMIKTWNSWDTIEIVPEATVLKGPLVETAATQTATAPLIRTTPNFPLAESVDSVACKRILDSRLYPYIRHKPRYRRSEPYYMSYILILSPHPKS
jgi:hypothetical protein